MAKAFKVGDKVRVIVSSSDSLPIGSVAILSRVDNSDNTLKYWIDATETSESSWHKFSHVEHVIENEEFILNERDALLSKVAELDAKLKWMREVGAEEFDRNQFRVWEVLTVVENDGMSKLDKAKAIAALVK